METCEHRTCNGCPMRVGRRGFLTTVGVSALAFKVGLLDFASSLLGAQPQPSSKPRVRAVFVRPKADRYWMGWPGAAYDIPARQADYTKTLNEAAEKHGVQLELASEPISDQAEMNGLLDQLKQSPPDGVIMTAMSLNTAWPLIDHFVAQRGEIPTIVFSPMGTSFTGHLRGTRDKPKTLVAATQDYGWLAEGVRMFRVMWDMKNSRICIVTGDKTDDRPLEPIGTTLHYIPHDRWLQQVEKTEMSDEMKAIADYYAKEAKKIVEPKAEDVLNAAKMYVVARQIMADEDCQGISLNCLPLIEGKKVPCGPCLAWSKLNDEGSVGACEREANSAISMRLNALLNRRPGFMQDPAPNTVNNTLMGAHCSCPTKLDGFDNPGHEPFILRTHAEPNRGVATQVLWRIGQDVTVMKFEGPTKIILGTGRVVANIDTPPSGGCRTSVELAMDDVADSRDCRGFHQLFIYGNLERPFKAYCQLAGIEVTPIA